MTCILNHIRQYWYSRLTLKELVDQGLAENGYDLDLLFNQSYWKLFNAELYTVKFDEIDTPMRNEILKLVNEKLKKG